MEIVLNILMPYYFFVFVAVGVIGSLAINLDGTVYEVNDVLIDKHDFIRCVFMYQVASYQFLREEINVCGIVILELLITASVWYLNVIIFGILIIILILKAICHMFYIVFRKRNKN